MLQMKATQDANLKEWLKRKENVYTSSTIQNEIIKLMGLQLLRIWQYNFKHHLFLQLWQTKRLMLPTLNKSLSSFVGLLMIYRFMKILSVVQCYFHCC